MAKESSDTAKFPGGSVALEPGELRIAIDKRAYAAIIGHAMAEPDVEVCGVLVGKVQRDAQGEWVHVTDLIQGQAAKQEGAQVTFTHETWNHIHGEMDRRHPDEDIVGWYHTHGGFGVFLSEMDSFIHENFFSAPHHLAYVYDPLAGTEGFFRKHDGKLQPVRRYWLGGRERKVVLQTAADNAAEKGADSKEIAAALQRTAQALHAMSISRQGESSPLLLWLAVAVAIVLAGYSLLVRPALEAGPHGGELRPMLLLESDDRGERAVGVELRSLIRHEGPVYRDENGHLFVGLEAKGSAGSPALALLERTRAAAPAASSAASNNTRYELGPPGRARPASGARRWTLVGAAAAVVLIIVTVIGVVFFRTRLRRR